MEFFRKGLEDSITLPLHPPNEDEIQEVRNAVTNRTAKDVESIKNHDRVPFYAIEKYCEENGLIFHDGEFKDLIYSANPIIGHFKKQFKRKKQKISYLCKRPTIFTKQEIKSIIR